MVSGKRHGWKSYTLRMPPELYDKLAEAAGLESVNTEIVSRLEASFRQKTAMELLGQGRPDALKALQDRVDALEARCEKLERKRVK